MNSGIRIIEIDTVLLDVPTHALSMVTMSGQTMMVVRPHCSDEISGLGKGATIGGLAYGAERPESMKLAIDQYIAPLLIGSDATRVGLAMD
ncbi:MAG: hypothetical protein ACREEJ_11705 [Ensifer adhaerens]